LKVRKWLYNFISNLFFGQKSCVEKNKQLKQKNITSKGLISLFNISYSCGDNVTEETPTTQPVVVVGGGVFGIWRRLMGSQIMVSIG
jgi:hypothetical protein